MNKNNNSILLPINIYLFLKIPANYQIILKELEHYHYNY